LRSKLLMAMGPALVQVSGVGLEKRFGMLW
jgi:hypothetical protein